MVTSKRGGGRSGDPTRGSGDDKVTEAVEPDLEGGNQRAEPAGTNAADPARGGCAGFGWGCLPILIGVLMLPAGLLF